MPNIIGQFEKNGVDVYYNLISVHSQVVSDKAYALQWTDYTGLDPDYYKVYYGPLEGSSDDIKELTTNSNELFLTGLTPNTEYTIVIAPYKDGYEYLTQEKHLGGAQFYSTAAPTINGWVKVGDVWYYYNQAANQLKSGWLWSGSKWYYLGADYKMATGWVKSNSVWYFMNETTGAMTTGWVRTGNTWYYMNSSGIMQTGWVKAGGKWYYMSAGGAMQTGWVKSGSSWYYLTPGSGIMATGWVQTGGSWYYLSSSGIMQIGWIQTGGKWYYLYSDGRMAANTTIGSYKLGSDGAWIQ